MRDKWWVALVKTLNLSAKSFMRRDIQSQACALTYRTLLAAAPKSGLLGLLEAAGLESPFADGHLSELADDLVARLR